MLDENELLFDQLYEKTKDFGGSYKSIIAYTPDKKVSRAHTPIGTLKIIDTFEEIQNQNKEYKEVIDKAIEYINGTYEMAVYTKSISLYEENIEDLLAILKEVK